MAFDFDHAVTAPFRMQPGLRRLDPGEPQLTPAVGTIRDRSRHLLEKLAVLRAFPGEALCGTAGFDAGPALAALSAQAAREHPAQWAEGEAGRWRALALGWSVDASGGVRDDGGAWPEVGDCLAGLDPAWRRAALLALAFVEDFAIVDAASGCIPWLAVALPSGWTPREKVGRHFADIHAPVADNERVLAAADALMRLVGGDARWERFVWTVTPHPRLHALPRHLDPAGWQHVMDAEGLPARAWLRSERQTFIPVPGCAQAVFTIAVELQPLADTMIDAARAGRLHAAIASMSDAVVAYKGLGPIREPLLRWLDERAAP